MPLIIKNILSVAVLFLCFSVSVNADLQSESRAENTKPVLKGSVQLAVAAAGSRLVSVGERGSIFRLDPGEVDWTKTGTPVEVTLTDIFFLDENTGWVVGHSGAVLETTDGGDSWKQILDGDTAAQIELAAAKNDKTEFSESRLRKAQRLVNEGADKPFLSVSFLDKYRGIIVGAYGLIYQTEDGGVTWTSLKGGMDNGDERHLYKVSMLNDGGAIIVGEEGRIYLQSAWGEAFNRIESPYEGTLFGSVIKGSDIIVYGLRGSVYRSVDRGLNWQKIELPPISITDGIVVSDGHVVLANEYGQLFISFDAEKSFIPIELNSNNPISSVVETADHSLVVAGVRGINLYERFGDVWR